SGPAEEGRGPCACQRIGRICARLFRLESVVSILEEAEELPGWAEAVAGAKDRLTRAVDPAVLSLCKGAGARPPLVAVYDEAQRAGHVAGRILGHGEPPVSG